MSAPRIWTSFLFAGKAMPVRILIDLLPELKIINRYDTKSLLAGFAQDLNEVQ